MNYSRVPAAAEILQISEEPARLGCHSPGWLCRRPPPHLQVQQSFVGPRVQSEVLGQGDILRAAPPAAPLPGEAREPPSPGRGGHHPGARHPQPRGDSETHRCALFPAASGRSCAGRALPAPASPAPIPAVSERPPRPRIPGPPLQPLPCSRGGAGEKAVAVPRPKARVTQGTSQGLNRGSGLR